MNNTVIPKLIALLICATLAPADSAEGAQPQQPRLPQMTAEARHAILSEAGLATIDECRRITEDGEEVFEVDITRNGIERSFTVALDGTLRSRQVFIGDLTLPVQRAVAALQRIGKVNSIHWCDEDGDHVYEIEVINGEDKRFYTVGLDGTFQATQVRMNEVPEPVQKAIREQAGKARVLYIGRSELDAGQVYDALLLKDGKRRVVSIGVDGSIQAVQVGLNELPQPVQKTITATAGLAKVIYVGRSEEDGDVTFSVITVDNALKKEFVVGLNGELLATVIPVTEAPDIVQRTLREKAGAGRVLHVQRLIDGSGYDAEVFTGGKKTTISIAPDGKVR